MACVFHWIWIPFCWYSGFTAVTIIPFHSFSMATTQGQVITCKGSLSLSLFSLFTIKAYLLSLSLLLSFTRESLKRTVFMVKPRWPGNPTSHCPSRTFRWRRRRMERSVSKFSTLLSVTPMLTLGAARYITFHSYLPIFWFHIRVFSLLIWLVFSVSGYNTRSTI